MRCILPLFFIFILSGALAQDFNVEYKSFLLQSFIKERQIKRITIFESNDSSFLHKRIQYELQFDSKGRLTKVYDYYFDRDTIPERMIKYAYKGEDCYYNSKTYYYLDEYKNAVLKKRWLMHFDFLNNVMEEQFMEGTKKFRTNNLVFNKAMQLLSRTVHAFVIKMRTVFTYNRDGLLKQVRLIKDNATVKNLQHIELNQYLQYNEYRKVMTTEQWIGERDKQVNEYFFNYKGQQIIAKIGWSLVDWIGSDQKLVERTNFDYYSNGLLKSADYFTQKQLSKKHLYTGFQYDYFTTNAIKKASSHRFTMLWFTDMFAGNLANP